MRNHQFTFDSSYEVFLTLSLSNLVSREEEEEEEEVCLMLKKPRLQPKKEEEITMINL